MRADLGPLLPEVRSRVGEQLCRGVQRQAPGVEAGGAERAARLHPRVAVDVDPEARDAAAEAEDERVVAGGDHEVRAARQRGRLRGRQEPQRRGGRAEAGECAQQLVTDAQVADERPVERALVRDQDDLRPRRAGELGELPCQRCEEGSGIRRAAQRRDRHRDPRAVRHGHGRVPIAEQERVVELERQALRRDAELRGERQGVGLADADERRVRQRAGEQLALAVGEHRADRLAAHDHRQPAARGQFDQGHALVQVLRPRRREVPAAGDEQPARAVERGQDGARRVAVRDRRHVGEPEHLGETRLARRGVVAAREAEPRDGRDPRALRRVRGVDGHRDPVLRRTGARHERVEHRLVADVEGGPVADVADRDDGPALRALRGHSGALPSHGVGSRRMPIEATATTLPGVLLLQPRVFPDDRGFFCETYRENDLAAAGITEAFVQDNHSRSTRGVLRGLHFAIGEGSSKLVRCGRGRIWDAVVDLRAGSPTYGRWEGFELTDDSMQVLYVPAGFGHGFCVLSDVADVLYKQSHYYDPAVERGIAWNDPQVGVEWPLPAEEIVVSERDTTAPLLTEISDDLPFVFQAA